MPCDQGLGPEDQIKSRVPRIKSPVLSGVAIALSYILVTFFAGLTTILKTVSTDATRAADQAPYESSPTTELVTGVVGDRCANCQAPLAPDQRYCLNCGERRGPARFSPETFTAQAAPAAADTPAPPRQHHPRLSSGASLVAGVATLLIALGVGVLIGHYSTDNTPAHAPAAQIITVGGGAGAATGTTANTGAASTASTASTSGKHPKAAKATVVHVTAKAAKAATAAASKVLGSSSNLSHNVTQQIGGSCSGGAGCQNGKFTGNFFPGG
jgi:hypothetical protein